MEQKFWEKVWQQKTMPYRTYPHPILLKLIKEFHHLNRILVPLCGVNYDLIWLAEQGFNVVGIDFANNTVEKFAKFYQVSLESIAPNEYAYYPKGLFTLYIKDFIKCLPTVEYDLIYDMGGLVALPLTKRVAYIQHLMKFFSANTLYALLVKNKTDATGPPFFIDRQALNSLFNQQEWQIHIFDREEAMDIQAYLIEKKVFAMSEE